MNYSIFKKQEYWVGVAAGVVGLYLYQRFLSSKKEGYNSGSIDNRWSGDIAVHNTSQKSVHVNFGKYVGNTRPMKYVQGKSLNVAPGQRVVIVKNPSMSEFLKGVKIDNVSLLIDQVGLPLNFANPSNPTMIVGPENGQLQWSR
jgi:hypothetical protein